jgi:hypothetical protein
MNRPALCVLLLSLCVSVQAREVCMHSASGDGGAGSDALTIPPTPATTKHQASPPTHVKARPPQMLHSGDDDTGPHLPRWHSFLPGMFR